MRVLTALATTLLAGCSSLLGIQDPIAHGDGGVVDAPDAGPPVDHLVVNLTDLKLMQREVAHVRVTLVKADGTMSDVTATAQLTSNDTAVATTAAAGVITSGTQDGSTTINAILGNVAPGVVQLTVAGPCHPVINEVRSAGPGAGGINGAADEWVELYNPCLDPINITDWTLDYRGPNTISGADDSLLFTLSGPFESAGFRLYTGASFSGLAVPDGQWTGTSGKLGGGSGSVGLRRGPITTGPLVDAFAYGDVLDGHPFRERTPTLVLTSLVTASRRPFDGNDTGDNSADFVLSTTATPRAMNAP